MKKILICLSAFLMFSTLSHSLIAQKSGKYYSFSTERRVGKVKVKYNEKDNMLELKSGRLSVSLYRDRTKTYKAYKGKMYYREGSNSRRVFVMDDGSLLVTDYMYASDAGNCQVKYNQKKDHAIIYLSLDKAKTSAMTKEKAIKMFEDVFSDVCKAYRVYQELRLAKVQLPAEGMKKPTLLPKAIEVAKKWIAGRRWKEKIIGGYFYSKEWNTIRHKRSGTILGRRARLIGLMKMPDGRCKFGHFMLRQNFNGSKYGVTFCEANSRVFEVSCSKVKAKLGQ